MPAFDNVTLTRLLASIEAGWLLILCGAGLSMQPPSSLWSAQRVARACYDKWLATERLPVAMRDDIEQLAAHFYANGLFETAFLRSLVPWDDLVGEPNAGHAAVADLLISRATHAALSANFDPLIEHWAKARKVAMRGALDGAEAVNFANSKSPLLKFHGCLDRDRDHTLWTQGQIGKAPVKQRLENFAAWMSINLPGKDLLVVGFWTDWGYLNDIFANVIALHGIGSVTVVDPLTTAELQAKAPTLWAKLTGSAAPFQHVQASSSDALDELRAGFSKAWVRKLFALGKPFLEAEGGTYSAASVDPAVMGTDDVYNLRRDSEGAPYNRAARRKEPAVESGKTAFAHLLLIQAGLCEAEPGISMVTALSASYTAQGSRLRLSESIIMNRPRCRRRTSLFVRAPKH